MQSTRYTRRNAESAFRALAEAVGAKVADPSWEMTDPRREGAWLLDNNGAYGGYVIAAYVRSSQVDGWPQSYTAETHPLGSERFPAREFTQRCWFAVRAIEMAKR